MHKDIVLIEKDDRVLSLNIKTANNQQYAIGIEIQEHEFGAENADVQVNIHKLRNSEDGQSCRGAMGPNAILYMEKAIAIKKDKDSNIVPSIWYEFHEKPGLPYVDSEK